MSTNSDEKIGYRNPPKRTQFEKGHSGNPKGRPKGKRNLATVLGKTLQEKVVINENGRRKTITKIEAAVKQLVNKAASGDIRAMHHLTALARSAEERSPAAITPTSVMAEVDQKVLQGIFSRFGQNGTGGRDDEPDEKMNMLLSCAGASMRSLRVPSMNSTATPNSAQIGTSKSLPLNWRLAGGEKPSG